MSSLSSLPFLSSSATLKEAESSSKQSKLNPFKVFQKQFGKEQGLVAACNILKGNEKKLL